MIYAALVVVAALFLWVAHDLWRTYERLRVYDPGGDVIYNTETGEQMHVTSIKQPDRREAKRGIVLPSDREREP